MEVSWNNNETGRSSLPVLRRTALVRAAPMSRAGAWGRSAHHPLYCINQLAYHARAATAAVGPTLIGQSSREHRAPNTPTPYRHATHLFPALCNVTASF